MNPEDPKEGKAIALFDSGIGGLTVAHAVAKRLPNERLIYLGDTARLPYGSKSKESVRRYAEEAVAFLRQYPLKAIVIACNTATAFALDALKENSEIPVLGVIGPGARAAGKATKDGKIGVMATEGTVRSGAYLKELAKALNLPLESIDERCIAHAAPLLVPLAEEGWRDHPACFAALETYLGPFVRARCETLVLGCTHYPILKPAIERCLKESFGLAENKLKLVDSAETLAEELAVILEERQVLNQEAPTSAHRFYCTDAKERFQKIGSLFFEKELENVELVKLG